MNLIYLCVPLTADGQKAYEDTLIDLGRVAMAHDCLPYFPYTLLSRVTSEPEKAEQEMMRHCSAIWVFGDAVTDRMYHDLQAARQWKLPIRYFHMNGQEKQPMTIAIDGPSGAGKTTMARMIADMYPIFRYVDTGAFYRTIALALQDQMPDKGLPKDLNTQLDALSISADYQNRYQVMRLNGKPVSDQELRTEIISQLASRLSEHPSVRKTVNRAIRDYASRYHVVMEGRDTGTAVMPNADLKIYLDAPVEIRAERRRKQLLQKGEIVPFAQVLDDLIQRDTRDTNRKCDPLRMATDAMYLNNENLDLAQTRAALGSILSGAFPAL